MTTRRSGRELHDRPALRTAEPRIPASAGVGTWLWCWIAGQVAATPIVLRWGPSSGEATAVWVVALTSAIAWSVYVIGIRFVSIRAGTGRVLDDLGVRWRLSDVAGIGIGVLVQLVVVPLVYVPLRAFWPGVFTDHRLRETANGMVENARGFWLVVLVGTIAIGAPIVEELVYRGLVQGSLANRFSDMTAMLATAALFTAIHFRPYEYPGLFAFSLAVGAATLLTRRLGLGVMIHVGFNATGLALAYL